MKLRGFPALMFAAGGIAVNLFALGCASTPATWTPESVQPPSALSVGIETPPSIATQAEPVAIPDAPHADAPVALTRDGAILAALRGNRGIEVARFGPRIGATYAPEARSAFDPAVLATVSTGRANRPVISTLTPVTASAGSSNVEQLVSNASKLIVAAEGPFTEPVTVDDTQASTAVRQYFPTGTEVFLTGAITASDSSVAGDDNQGSWTFGVSQALLKGAGPSVNLVALKQAQNRAAQSDQAFRASVLDTVRQVELTYWNLVMAGEVLNIRTFAVKLADEQLARAESMLSVGKAIEGDVMAAKAEKASRMADLADAEASLRRQTLAMIRLLAPETEQRWDIVFAPADPAEAVQVEVDPGVSEQLALKFRPELAQARLDAANLELNVEKARNDLLPRVDLTGSYGRASRGVSSSDMTGSWDDPGYENYRIGIEFEMPVLNRGEKARLERAELVNAQAGRSLSNIELGLASEVRQAAVEVTSLWERLTAARESLASRSEQYRVAVGRFEAGRTMNLDLLIAERDLIQSRIDEVSARVRCVQALTVLYAAEGTLLERRGITMDLAEHAAQDQ